jgi:hypothetical protein
MQSCISHTNRQRKLVPSPLKLADVTNIKTFKGYQKSVPVALSFGPRFDSSSLRRYIAPLHPSRLAAACSSTLTDVVWQTRLEPRSMQQPRRAGLHPLSSPDYLPSKTSPTMRSTAHVQRYQKRRLRHPAHPSANEAGLLPILAIPLFLRLARHNHPGYPQCLERSVCLAAACCEAYFSF